MEQKIDFSKTQVIKTLNPRKDTVAKPTGPKQSPYHVILLPEKEKVRFSAVMFEQLGLNNNSLSNGPNPELPGKMLLIVSPGNAGLWAKARGSREKGRAFKNKNLIKGLRELGMNGNYFNLESLGDDDKGNQYYSFVEYTGPVTVRKTSAKKDDDAEEEEEEAVAQPVAQTKAKKAAAPAPVPAPEQEDEERFNA